MGETDNPSFLDRIRSDAHHSILPLRNEQSTSSASIQKDACLHNTISSSDNEKSGDHDGNPTGNSVADNTSGENPPPAPPPEVGTEEQQELAITTRLKNGAVRFVTHTREALTRSWINLLLVFVPAGIAVKAAGLNPSIVFALNAIAVIPLAGILTHATESVASRLGDTWGALLNVSFGNAVELIIFIIALVKNEIQIVQASLLGSILANLLLILGMAFLFGGLRFREQIYNSTVTQMSACLLSLSVMSLLLPTAFHASFNDTGDADSKVLQISRGTSVVLLLVYVLYLLFQLKSHAYMYESTPQKIIDEESHPGVLAELMETSSESSDSSTGSDTDGSSSSHTTAKRIKRAFRNRRRRKSSASSTNTPSVVSSPGAEMTKTSLESGTKTGNGHLNGHFPRAALGDIMSGDEADTDANLPRRRSEPRVRDFQTEAGESSKSPVRSIDRPMQEKKKRKHKQKKHRKQSMKSPPTEHNEKEGTPGDNNFAPDESPQRQVGFVDEPQNSTPGPETSSAWRNLAIRQLSNRQSFRPGLPKVLSNTVFTTPPPGTSPALGPVNKPIPGSSNLRRTNSLPDRLNRPQPPAINSMSLPNPASVLRAASERTGPDYPSEEEDAPHLSRTSAIVMLLLSTGLVALCAEFLVDAIPAMTASSSVSQAFIGLIVLPIVGNAAEHVTAVTVATKNKMDLAIGVAVGSSIQIALFVTPLVVLLGWILGKAMSLYFNLFETISLFVTAFVVNFLVLDGRSNYLEGSLLIAAYVIIALAAFFYPDGANESQLGGSGASNGRI
ncbi:hypothetical protein EV356DRAFT_442831 [Viridothelium virens]|uniref:Sodium/calcium exchanger membrane region domain-containing protein n=1 Tax=Viridothelium virens TaxID=1048519 RepID=A0A6A6HFR7_VIRVR|nr:hypothetical protein EV356DRAFT_442831 [Viridothelium virens]